MSKKWIFLLLAIAVFFMIVRDDGSNLDDTNQDASQPEYNVYITGVVESYDYYDGGKMTVCYDLKLDTPFSYEFYDVNGVLVSWAGEKVYFDANASKIVKPYLGRKITIRGKIIPEWHGVLWMHNPSIQ